MGGSGAKHRRQFDRERHRAQAPAALAASVPAAASAARVPAAPAPGSAGAPAKAPKPAKPKHLKRKLEALAPDDPRRVSVLAQWRDFERAKAQLRLRQEPRRERPSDRRSGAAVWFEPAPQVNGWVDGKAADRRDGNSNSNTQKQSSADRSSGHTPPVVGTAARADGDTADNSDDEGNDEQHHGRVRRRGQKRRGRKDTFTAVSEMDPEQSTVASGTHDKVATLEEVVTTAPSAPPTPREPIRRSIKRIGDQRYCVGRRPITNFTLGSKHKGKVVYIKPYGIFIDIGCHSDAFCHVSRLADDFVENPEALFQPGDAIDDVRIVETDRRKKRITVSLQSEARMKDEKASLESRQARKRKRQNESSSGGTSNKRWNAPSCSPSFSDVHQNASTVFSSNLESFHHTTASRDTIKPSDPSDIKPGKELKRQQKLERRAARRQQQHALMADCTHN